MAEPYIGEIKMFAGNFAPVGWAFCDGQTIPISENDVLFNLIGTTYGGDGQSTFALPDMRGRVPIHFGNGFAQAQSGGAESVTLTANEMPAHTHAFMASTAAGSGTNPQGNMPAASPSINLYLADAASASMSPAAVGASGGGQAHSNFQPYLCVNFIIALQGIYPSQN